MSLWRAKRRFEANKKFNSSADEALLAIAVIRSRTKGEKLSYSDEELREMLGEGMDLLSEIRTSLLSPEKVDDYVYNLSQELVDERNMVSEDVAEELEGEIEVLEGIQESLAVVSGTDDVEETLETIEEIAGEASEDQSENIRSHLVN
jgi:hypothetical protein